MQDMPDMAAIVLAGGPGRRLGGDKAERLLMGKSMVDRALLAAGRQGGPLALSIRAPGAVVSSIEAEEVIDRPGWQGPLAGLAAGLDWALARRARFLLCVPCDAPFLPADHAPRLRARLEATSAAAAAPVSHSQPHFASALWRVDIRDRVEDYAKSGRSSLWGLCAELGAVLEDWGAPADDPFMNVNTPEEWAAAAARLSLPQRDGP